MDTRSLELLTIVLFCFLENDLFALPRLLDVLGITVKGRRRLISHSGETGRIRRMKIERQNLR